MSHEKLESLNSRSQKQERGSSTLKNIHIFLSAVAISIVGSDFYVTNDFNMESTFVLLFSLFFFFNIIRFIIPKISGLPPATHNNEYTHTGNCHRFFVVSLPDCFWIYDGG